MNRTSVATCTLALLFAVSSACRSEKSELERRPSLSGAARGWNVILLSIDTLRADRLSSYGYTERETSPNLDGLLSGGVRFEDATAQRATTWPSLASALTGLYPSGHGVIQNGYGFPDDVPTLPLMLQQAGYQTAAFLGNMCRANHRGWDAFKCTRSGDGRLVRLVSNWNEQLNPEKPFFLWLHYFGAHGPYLNGQKLAAQELDPEYAGIVAPKKFRLNRIMTEGIQLTDADQQHLDALYDAAVMGTDRYIGYMLTLLNERRLLDRTVIVLLADHGEDLYDHHGYLYHACSVYQTGLQVPFGLVAPGILAAGATVSGPVELVDVAPTLIDLLGLEPPTELHGHSLLPLLTSKPPAASARQAYSEYGSTAIHTVTDGRWKLVDNPEEFVPICFQGAPTDLYPLQRVELYDLESDPQELHNLAAQRPEKVAELQGLIRHRFTGLGERNQPQDVPEDLKEELRALGYLAN